MNLHPHRHSQGIALIIVMIVIISLGILAGGFAYSMKVETTLARNASMDSDLEWMGRSGIELAKYVLAQPVVGGMGVDALNQKWAGGTGETNSPVADVPLDHFELGPDRWISVRIVDLDRKFNINTVILNGLRDGNVDVLRQALILIDVDPGQSSLIINGLLDWVDADDEPRMGSSDTESSFYSRLEIPYRAKNNLIDDMSELMLIHGITPAMYYGSARVGPFPPRAIWQSAMDRKTPLDTMHPVGFVDLFTTLSSGQVNINTAPPAVLQLIPEVEENLAQAIVAARAGPDGMEGNEDDTPFRGVQELMRVPGMPPALIGQFARYFSVRSTTFEVHVAAHLAGYRREYVGIVRRDGNRLQTLYFYWD